MGRKVFCRHWANRDLSAEPQDTRGWSWLENRDRKIMCHPLLATVDCMRQVMAEAEIDNLQREKTALFVATGLSFDAVSDEVALVLHSLKRYGCDAHGVAELDKSLPPLTGVKALTNAGAFYICKYTGVRGPGTTFGNTSHAGITALQAGFSAIASGQCEYALIGAYDDDGDLLRVARASLTGAQIEAWIPKASAAAVLLQARPTSGAKTLATLEIQGKASLCGSHRPWQSQTPNSANLFYHAGFHEDAWALAAHRAQELSPKPHPPISKFDGSKHSHFPGDWGATGVLMQSCAALDSLEGENPGTQARVLDWDPYGREGHLIWEAT